MKRVLLLLLIPALALAAVGGGRTVDPGQAQPVAAPAVQILRITWGGDYQSLILIDDGLDVRRPAVVATMTRDLGRLQVAYGGSAFIAADGELHIDSRQMRIVGPLHERWSCDSFAIAATGAVRILDDQNRDSVGRVTERIMPEQQEQFARLRLLVQVFVDTVL